MLYQYWHSKQKIAKSCTFSFISTRICLCLFNPYNLNFCVSIIHNMCLSHFYLLHLEILLMSSAEETSKLKMSEVRYLLSLYWWTVFPPSLHLQKLTYDVLIRLLQRNKTNRMCVYVYRRFIIRNWLTQFWKLANSNLQCGLADWRPRRANGADGSPKAACWIVSRLPGINSLFILFRLSIHWMRPTCILKDNLLTQNSPI